MYLSLNAIAERKKIVSFITMFFLGINIFFIYFPIVILYWLLYVRSTRVGLSVFLFYGMVTLSILTLFLIGHDRMTLDNSWQVFIAFNITLITSTLILEITNLEGKVKVLVIYILGVGVVPLISVSYSFLFNDGSYGRGLIYNPITNNTTNSPLASNNLSLLASVFIYWLFKQEQLVYKLLCILCVGVISFLGAFLGGRTYFIIIGFAFVFLFLLGKERKKLQTSLVLGFVVVFFIFVFWEQAVFLQEKLAILNERFKAGMATGDVRFELIADGFKQLLTHPLGGYEVNSSISSVRWFHNIFIDMGRLAGWIPVILLILSIIYVLLKSIKKVFIGNKSYKIPLMFFLLSFLLLQQDIAIEGDYRVLIVMVLSGVILIGRESHIRARS